MDQGTYSGIRDLSRTRVFDMGRVLVLYWVFLKVHVLGPGILPPCYPGEAKTSIHVYSFGLRLISKLLHCKGFIMTQDTII